MHSPWISTAFLFLCFHYILGQDHPPEYEYPPFDGWYNNYAHPDWGAAETPLFRRVPPAYADGVYEPSGQDRPNPIELSQSLMGGPTGHPSARNRTAFLVFFGQQMVEEILDAQRPGCPPEYFNVKVPKDHHYNEKGLDDLEMPVLRSRYSFATGYSPSVPREQLNEISAFLDGTLMYGPNKAWSDALRSFQNGRLKATNDSMGMDAGYYPAHNDIRLPYANPPPPRDHVLKPINRFFTIGNPRGNENPFLLTFGILWFRYHNYMADKIQAQHPTWTDEQVFNEARKWVIATHQKIVYYDWLPNWLGENGLEPYNKSYDPTIHPGIAHVFQSAAMRFGHTLVPPGVYRRSPVHQDGTCTFYKTTSKTKFADKAALRTCNAYWNPTEGVTEYGIEAFLMGMASQLCEREDNIITPDLRGDVFGPLEFSRRDLMALNIQRARDHGIPDYNTVREAYGLPKRKAFSEINPTFFATERGAEVLKNLTNIYKNDSTGIDRVDLWVGGILETTEQGPGQTFRTIIKDQFRRIRNGDRFWFENYEFNKLFTKEEIEEIRNITIKKVVLWTTTIRDEDIQDNPFNIAGAPCFQPQQLNHSDDTLLESCTKKQTFDYFHKSEVSYILTLVGLGLFLIFCIMLLIFLAKRHQSEVEQTLQRNRNKSVRKSQSEVYAALEWVGPSEEEHSVLVKLDDKRKHIQIMTERHKPIRTIDLNVPIKRNVKVDVVLSADNGMRTLAIRLQNEYDMILKFENITTRDAFQQQLQRFFESIGVNHIKSPPIMAEKLLLKSATTKKDRQKLLEKFFRITFSHAFKYESEPADTSQFREYKEILKCELTRYEFAEALSLKPNSMFVDNMFNLVDKDQDGYICYREFLDVIIIFAKGSADEKAKLLFDMYAFGESSDSLSREDFKTMLRSLLELSNETISDDKIDEVVEALFRDAGLEAKERITFADFSKLLLDYKDALNYASLTIEGAPPAEQTKQVKRENAPSRARRTLHRAYRSDIDEKTSKSRNAQKRLTSHNVSVETKKRDYPKTPTQQKVTTFLNYVENNRRQIFWVTLYTLVTAGIFIERAYYYSVEREHSGLRRIAGYGVTVTRGAASGMMFTYACLMVTMCRNVITWLRETVFNRYIPFDSYITMHQYIAFLALLFTLMHIIGHAFNLYHICTQTADDLTCLFRDYFHATHELPKFHYWAYMTLTGFTGILLTMVIIAMFVFAIPYSRRHTYRAFWFTHHMYVILIILTFLHGMGRMIQPPFTHYFFLGPLVLFALDKLISVSRKKVEIVVVKAELLPSEVTFLEFRKPQNFEYKSGQWVRIASLVHNKNEYHPFTLTSAPHEENLMLHIRAVGPWTWNLRHVYDPNSIRAHALPRIYLDGPYGEGHQDWYKFEVAVLVGGGIGVTPFASILKDLAYKSQQGAKVTCKKVYFLWVTRTQRQFEWMTDIIRQVEEQDVRDLVSVHIFITEFREKFDIRTTMLYICERHFQKISNRSLFTGLRSVTHFGRPDFESFFKLLPLEHSDVNVFGVFSCGPPPMTSSVEKACSSLNKYSTDSHFVHHYENF